MSGKLVHVPFDKGIDENAETAGALQTTALARCTNLWHAKAGALYPRPGTAERAITVDNAGPVNLLGNAAGSNLVMVDGTLYVDQDGTGIDAGRVMPFGGFDQWTLGQPNPTPCRTDAIYHNGRWYFAWELSAVGGVVTVSVFDEETRVLLYTHSSTTARFPTFAIAGDTVVLYTSKSTDTDGIYSWDLETWTDTLAATAGWAITELRADSDGTNIYVFSTFSVSVSVSTYTAPVATPDSLALVETLTTGATPYLGTISAHSRTMLVYASTGTELTARIYEAGAGLSSTVIVSGGTQPVGPMALAPAEDGVAGVWVVTTAYPSGSSVGLYTQRVSWGGSVTPAHSLLLPETGVLGGGFAARDTSFIWVALNNSAGSLFRALVLVDIKTGEIVARNGSIPATGQFTNYWLTREGYTIGNKMAACLSVLNLSSGFVNTTDSRNDVLEIRDISAGNGDTASSRQLLQFNGGAYIPGDQLMSWNGGVLAPAILAVAPYIRSASGNVSGSMTPGATYQYAAAYTYQDESGLDHIGPLSPITEVTLGGGDGSVDLIFSTQTPIAINRTPGATYDGITRLIYRTVGNGSVLYLINRSPTNDTVPSLGYTDTASDTSIEDNPLAYTVGGELSHDPAPPARFGCVGKLRMWLAGQYNPFRVSFSMESLRGEVPAFPDFPGYFLDFDSEITGIASIDDTVAVFTERETYLVTGDGPDRIGNGSFQVRPIGVGVGCSDWRSVASSPIGIFFAGNQTIWLLPRGFAAPVNIGGMIADTLRQYPVVISAVLADYGDQQLMHFLLKTTGDYTGGAIQVEGETIQIDGDDYIQISESESRHMVFSLATQQWYRWANDDYAPLVAGLMRRPQEDNGTEQLVYASALTGAGETVTTREEQFWQPFDVVGEDSALPAVEIQTHQWHPWGLTGVAAVDRVWWRVRVDEEQPVWSLTEVSDGASHAPLTITPANRAGWQNIEFRMPWARVPELGLTLSARSAAFAGLTYEVTAEGFAKERTAQRTG